MLNTRSETFYNKDTKVWNSLKFVPLYNPAVSAGQVLLTSLARNPEKIGQISANSGIQFKNEEIRIMAIRAAQNLQNLGIKQRDILTFFGKNSEYLAPIFIASLTIGAIINAVDPRLKKDELSYKMTRITSKIIFCDSDNVEVVEKSLEAINCKNVLVYIFDGIVTDTRSVRTLFIETGIENVFVPPSIGNGSKEIAMILWSSGTTGMPKGVCLSHANILNQSAFMRYNETDIVFCFSPIFWLSGFICLFPTIIAGSCRIITTSFFNAELAFDIIEKYQITILLSPPSTIVSLINHPNIESCNFSSIKNYWCGGSIVHKSIIEKMNKYLPNGKVNIIYGQTESVGAISTNITGQNYDSVGFLENGVQVKIVDAANKECDINEIGEICPKLPFEFLGYFGDESATKLLYRDDGFIKTGDLGYFDADGFLYYVDRIKDIIKYNNNQVSPSEIEEIIKKMKGVQDVCVFGIPDLNYGDLPAAIVVTNKSECTISSDIINTHLADTLSDAKQLRGGIYFVESLPQGPTGKILRREAYKWIKSQNLLKID